MKKRRQSKSFLMAGGLGNQLFILTAGSYYSLKNKENVIFDLSSYTNRNKPHASDIRSLNPDAIFQYRPYRWIIKAGLEQILKRALFPTHTSSGVGYDPALESQVLENEIFGYFQTYKYLEQPEVRNLIDSLYLSSTSEWFGKCLSDMQELPTVSVHIRRGCSRYL